MIAIEELGMKEFEDLGTIIQELKEKLWQMGNAEQAANAQNGQGVLGFATGGRVPGAGSGDTVHARLEPGEFVIAKNVASRYYSELERLNKGGIAHEAFENVFTSSTNDLSNTKNALAISANNTGNHARKIDSASYVHELSPGDHITNRYCNATNKDNQVVYRGLALRDAIRNIHGDSQTKQNYQVGGIVKKDRQDEWKESNLMVAGDIARTVVTRPILGTGSLLAWGGESIMGAGAGLTSKYIQGGTFWGGFENMQGRLGSGKITEFDDYLNKGNILSETSLADATITAAYLGEKVGLPGMMSEAERQHFFENKQQRFNERQQRVKKQGRNSNIDPYNYAMAFTEIQGDTATEFAGLGAGIFRTLAGGTKKLPYIKSLSEIDNIANREYLREIIMRVNQNPYLLTVNELLDKGVSEKEILKLLDTKYHLDDNTTRILFEGMKRTNISVNNLPDSIGIKNTKLQGAHGSYAWDDTLQFNQSSFTGADRITLQFPLKHCLFYQKILIFDKIGKILRVTQQVY